MVIKDRSVVMHGSLCWEPGGRRMGHLGLMAAVAMLCLAGVAQADFQVIGTVNAVPDLHTAMFAYNDPGQWDVWDQEFIGSDMGICDPYSTVSLVPAGSARSRCGVSKFDPSLGTLSQVDVTIHIQTALGLDMKTAMAASQEWVDWSPSVDGQSFRYSMESKLLGVPNSGTASLSVDLVTDPGTIEFDIGGDEVFDLQYDDGSYVSITNGYAWDEVSFSVDPSLAVRSAGDLMLWFETTVDFEYSDWFLGSDPTGACAIGVELSHIPETYATVTYIYTPHPVPPSVVPEPASVALMGAAAVACFRRRKMG